MLLLGGREGGLDLREASDVVRPRGTFRRALELTEFLLHFRRHGDAGAGEAARGLHRAFPAGLDRARDGLAEIVRERLGLKLDPIPVGTTGELAQLDQPFRGLGRRDPQGLEERDLLFDFFLQGFCGLPLFLEGLGLLLEDPGEAGGPDAADITGP